MLKAEVSMNVAGVVDEGGLIRPLYPIHRPRGTEVKIVLPEDEVDEQEKARRRKVGELHRRLTPIDIRPLTTTQIVREDRDGR